VAVRRKPLLRRVANWAVRQLSGWADPDQWLLDAAGGGKSAAGVTVTESSSLRVAAVFACVRVLAESIASLPLPVYRRLPGDGKERAPEHPLYTLLHDQPNPEMSSFEFREFMMFNLSLWGNAYAEIEFDRAERVRALWPLRAARMQVRRPRPGEPLEYEYLLSDGRRVKLPPWRVLHIRGLSGDGVVGYSPIRCAREAVALALATQEFGARFFSGGAQLGGFLEHPGNLSENARENLEASFERKYQGLKNAHRWAVLEEGMKATPVGIPPEDAQYLETRKFQIGEVARIFRVPPHLIGDLDRATYSNIEHQSLEFVIHTIRPWAARWEQAIWCQLLWPNERREYFAEFLLQGLLRGDIQSRYQAYAIGRQWGWLSADDIRKLENLNPLSDGRGSIYLQPLNMVEAGAPPDRPADGTRGAVVNPTELRALRSAGSRQRLARAHRRPTAPRRGDLRGLARGVLRIGSPGFHGDPDVARRADLHGGTAAGGCRGDRGAGGDDSRAGDICPGIRGSPGGPADRVIGGPAAGGAAPGRRRGSRCPRGGAGPNR